MKLAPVVIVWLFNHRGGYALLMIDANTGQSEQVPIYLASESGGRSCISTSHRIG